MTPKEILNYVKAQPFRPFRIGMANGRSFDIRHPKTVEVGTRDLLIFEFVGDSPQVYDGWDSVSLSLVESLSYLETPVARERTAMMTSKEIMGHVFAEPFRPFRIHTASGRTFEIRHPEVVQIGKSTLTIFTPLADIPDAQGPWYKISLMLIESIEPLDAPVQTKTEQS
jgi:hypothetical protein